MPPIIDKKTGKSFDVYIDADPTDTIPITFATVADVKSTIRKLEALYKQKKYPHIRISQVANIMAVRLNVYKDKRDQYALAERYVTFLKERTKLPDADRYKAVFKV